MKGKEVRAYCIKNTDKTLWITTINKHETNCKIVFVGE